VSRVRDIVTEVEDGAITPGIQAVMIALRDAVGEAEGGDRPAAAPRRVRRTLVRVG
jgi:hypothetical protein